MYPLRDTADANQLWAAPCADVIAKLSGSASGLTSGEVARRLSVYGPNRIEVKPRRRLLFDFLKRFANPLVLVLLGAAAIAAATGDPASFAIIATIVVLSVCLDFVQERRAQNAAEKLSERVALNARVLRDGAEKDVKASGIVPGDIVMFSAGDLVPADCRVLEAKDLFVNQALLTGESYPAEKTAEPASAQAGGALPATGIFAGSSIVSGVAHAIVVKTGRATQLGAIAQSLRTEPPPTAFAVGIHKFGLLILRLTVLLVLFVLLVNLLFHRPLLESFLFALALAVGLTPELLPMVVSVTLARGAIRMSEKQVIVKRLSAIHDLGSMDVLCSDKTGTLTQAKIALTRAVDLDGNESANALYAAYVNAALETGLKSPLDDAILATDDVDLAAWTKIDEVPFDFERRRVSVLVENAGRRRLIVKGAPEDILTLSSSYQSKDGVAPFPFGGDARTRAVERLAQFGRDGFRVLGVAWREADPHCDHARVGDESDLIFAGFVLFLDPPKETAGAALASLAELGVTVKVITGDNEHITAHVCEAIGLSAQTLLMGSELAALSDEALAARVQTVNVFCRVNPAQKARIIGALRRSGHVVGYLGDGINDAPSLHAADVGLSVDGAADVAKEAAAIILLRNDLGVVADGVREGRRTFANIMKYVMMGTSSNFGNMFSMAGGVLFLPFLPMLPIQILLNNLIYDISEIAIPMDNVDQAAVIRPEHWDMNIVRKFMFVFGPISSLFDFLTFWLLLHFFNDGEALFHTGWFLESLMTQILVIFVIRTRGSVLSSKPSTLLIASSLGALGIALLLPYTPLGRLLGFVAPPIGLIASLAGITAAYLIFTDIVKQIFYRIRLLGVAPRQRLQIGV
jgi:Mg2+-importing ATPase